MDRFVKQKILKLYMLMIFCGLCLGFSTQSAANNFGPCDLPDCVYAETAPPGGLLPEEIPQFVLITVDDAVNTIPMQLTNKILDMGHTNPNGAPLPMTFYVSTKWTNYHLVQQRYAEGCEVAVHTMTHTTGAETDYDTWYAEIAGARQALSELAMIPEADIVGFRAPFLFYNDDAFQALYDAGFLYDSSITEQVTPYLSTSISDFIFPYTLDYPTPQQCFGGECPQNSYPGLFEVPMWQYYQDGAVISVMDYSGDESSLLTMFKQHFHARYDYLTGGNRAPMGIFLHAAWLNDDAHANALNIFIEYAASQPDVWFVTSRQLVEWMRTPRSISQMDHFEWVNYIQPPTGVYESEVADGWDNNLNGAIDEGMVNECIYTESDWFNTCVPCPADYPVPDIVASKTIKASVVAQVILPPEGCAENAWDADKPYNGGAVVSYEFHKWEARYWTKGNAPGASDHWIDRGLCGNASLETYGTMTPVGNVHVKVGDPQRFVMTPEVECAVKNVIVNGVSQGPLYEYTFPSVIDDGNTIVVEFAKGNRPTPLVPDILYLLLL